MNRTFAERIDLPARLGRARPWLQSFPTAAQRAIAAQLDDGWAVLERELVDRFSGSFSVESRFPFHDRRLIDFALAIPESQRWRATETKFVVRQACARLMPPSVRVRQSKADFSYLFAEMLERERAAETFRALRLADDGCIDPRQAALLFERWQAGSRRDLDAVWIIFTMERWYRTMFPGGRLDRSAQIDRRSGRGGR